jgi:hypothetical protein
MWSKQINCSAEVVEALHEVMYKGGGVPSHQRGLAGGPYGNTEANRHISDSLRLVTYL